MTIYKCISRGEIMNGKIYKVAENMTELQAIVEKLENGDVNLDDAIVEFQKAMDLIKNCDSKLKEAEETINKIVDENKDIVEFNSE